MDPTSPPAVPTPGAFGRRVRVDGPPRGFRQGRVGIGITEKYPAATRFDFHNASAKGGPPAWERKTPRRSVPA